MASPYHKNSEPRNSWELFTWIIFEPKLLEKYDKTLSKLETTRLFLKVYSLYIIPLATLLYVLGIALIALLDLPTLYPTAYKPEDLTDWQPQADFFTRFSVLYLKNFFGLAGGLAGDLAVGLAFTIFFYLCYFRIIFYPYYILKSWLPFTFANNFYLHDAVIWLPLWGVRAKFTTLAYSNPDEALQFVDFLLEYRPLQRALAMHITHAATAGHWTKQSLNADVLKSPAIAEDEKNFEPSDTWKTQLKKLRATLILAQQQNNLGLKKQYFADFVELLPQFREQTLRESERWNSYYLPAIDLWRAHSQDKLQQIELDAKNREPITENVYRIGDPLTPHLDQQIFLGRTDLRDQLSREILTARTLPLFLIQGQRRVGKSSLINFLPKLLGDRFKIIRQDLQEANCTISVTRWMQDLRDKVIRELNLTAAAWQPPENWLEAWWELQNFLKEISQQQECKIILALDEYEMLHKFFMKNPEVADSLLAAMRSFSQHQNQVVFMFVGSAYFSELENPHWGNHFVHTTALRVDYLKQLDAIDLITKPVKLNYPPEIIDTMYQLTQGHPALLQMLCKNMVDIANADLKKDMTVNDLNAAIERSLDFGNVAISVFWNQFCADPHCKQAVWDIIRHQPPTHANHLKRLERHGHIVKQNDQWQLRVPLFVQWIQEHGK